MPSLLVQPPSMLSVSTDNIDESCTNTAVLLVVIFFFSCGHLAIETLSLGWTIPSGIKLMGGGGRGL